MCTFEHKEGNNSSRHGLIWAPDGTSSPDPASQQSEVGCGDFWDSLAAQIADKGADLGPGCFPGADWELDVSAERLLTS
jgi:hypothetical protein